MSDTSSDTTTSRGHWLLEASDELFGFRGDMFWEVYDVEEVARGPKHWIWSTTPVSPANSLIMYEGGEDGEFSTAAAAAEGMCKAMGWKPLAAVDGAA